MVRHNAKGPSTMADHISHAQSFAICTGFVAGLEYR